MQCPKCHADNTDTARYCSNCATSLAPARDIRASLTKTMATSVKVPQGALFAGHYEIIEKIGQGGMGEVYLAKDTSLNRKVALKFLPEETYQDPAARSRFIREAKAAAALDHPYICSIHEVGESQSRLFFAMEYVEGRTLQDRISEGPLPLAEALPIAAEIAEALQVAHDKGLIHRDIKPANVMLTNKGHAKVMDFGLAKQIARPDADTAAEGLPVTVTGEGMTPGTPAYMSPEQLRGKVLDQRSDIFSFGILLYEMLGGRHPFKKETGLTTASAILNEEPQPIAKVIEGVPEGLQKVIGRMLAKDVDKRYPSMAEVRADLKRALAEAQGLNASPVLRPLRAVLTAAIVVVVVLGAAWLAKMLFFKTPAQALAFQPRDWILVTDFENKTGDPVFDAGLEAALTVSLQQSRHVNVFPPSRVQETLKRMERSDVKRIDEGIGREIALREGIKGILACGIGKVGADYLLTAKLVDPDKQITVFSDSARTKNKDEILASVDELAKKVRHGLGESLAKIATRRLTLYKATTSSLEALKYYSGSKRASGATAVQFLKQALDLDPDFALAHAELGVKYYISGNRTEGEKHFQKALSLLDRLTIREQLWIRALVEDWRGNRDQGIQNYKAYLVEYPDDSSALFRLGWALQASGQIESAIDTFKRYIEIDKDASDGYVNLATCYNVLNKQEEACAYYQKAFALNPEMETGTFVNNEYGFLLVRMGKIEEAERTFKKMTVVSDRIRKPKGFRSLALLQMYQGKYAAAQENLEEAILLNKALKAGLSEFRDHLFLAIACRRKGQEAAFEKELAAMERIRSAVKIEPSFLATLGTLYARSNKLREADRIFESVRAAMGDLLALSGVTRSAQSDQAYYQRLKGEIELARQKYEEAINSFGLVAKLREHLVQDSLALAYKKSGDTDKAINKYVEFLHDPLVLGNETQDVWNLAHYELGMLLEKKGDGAEAAKYYGRFLELWKDADPDISEVADARKRLVGLTGS